MDAIINGSKVKVSEASVNLFDLGFNRGYSIFDYFRFSNGQARFLKDHLSRLEQSLSKSNLELDISISALESMIIDLLQKSEFSEGSIRLTVSAGNSSNFSAPETSANYYILPSAFSKPNDSLYQIGAKLISRKYKRQFPSIKTTNYFYAQMNRNAMLEADAIDILYYDEYIRETSRANIFLIHNKEIYTPKSDILEGITRKNILSLCSDSKVQDITPEFMFECDEVFITSSSREIQPIVEIDGRKIGNGLVGEKTKEVMEKFSKLVKN